jgi:mannosyltransferase
MRWKPKGSAAEVLLPAGTALGLGCLGLSESQLWQDESSTWWATQLAPEDFARLLHNVDVVLAPYYLLMRAWVALFGDSEAALRAPSVVAMALSAGLVAQLARKLFEPGLGLRAGMIFALLPLVSRYAQEARPYALATLFAALSSWLLLRLCDRPASLPRAAAYAASLAALGSCHLLALSILPAQAACFVHLDGQRPWLHPSEGFRRFVLAACAGLACVAPLIVLGARQSGQIHTIPLMKPALRSFGVGALGLILISVSSLRTLATRRAPLTLALWALGPALLLVATHPVLHMYRLRYLTFTLPAWALLCAIGLEPAQASARTRGLITALTALALIVLGFEGQRAARGPTAHAKCDYRGAARDLAPRIRSHDALVFGGQGNQARHARLALSYQFRDGPPWNDVFAARSMAEMARFYAGECQEPATCLSAGVERVWLLTCAPSARLFEGVPGGREQLLKEQFDVRELHARSDVTLALLTRKTPAASAPRQ